MPPPTNIKNLFGNWLNNIDRKTKSRIRVGVYAILWTIWCSRNDVIFSNAMTSQFLQVMHDQQLALSPSLRPTGTYGF
jgi:hypothetical protein